MTDEVKVTPEQLNELTAKLNAADERAKRFEGQLKTAELELGKFKGVNLDKLKADADALEQLQRERAGQNPDDLKKWQEAQAAKIRADVQKELDELRENNKKLSSVNHELRVVDKAMEAIGGNFNEDVFPFLKEVVRRSVDVDEQGGFIVKDEQGQPRFSPVNPNKKLDLNEFAGELAAKHPSFAKPGVVKGGKQEGAKAGFNGIGVDVNRFMRLSPEQRNAIPAKERGALAIEALKGVRIGK